MPYRDKAKQRAAQAESARRKRRLKKSAGSTVARFDGEPLLKFRTINDTLSALERAVDLVLQDPEADSVSRARVILQAAANAARAIESAEIEGRITELEQRLTENREHE